MNYLDLAAAEDIGAPRQERLVGRVRRALRAGYRQKVRIAVTLPARLIKSAADADRHLDRRSAWLDGPIDFLVLGGLDRFTWPRLAALDIMSWVERLVADGRIGGLGFAFHDDYQALRAILDASDAWAFCQLRYSSPPTAGWRW